MNECWNCEGWTIAVRDADRRVYVFCFECHMHTLLRKSYAYVGNNQEAQA